MNRFQLYLAVLVPALLVAGCASPPTLDYYTLGPDGSVAEWDEPLYVSRVQVPEYLDDNRIWVRTATHRVESLPNVRWAERLPRAITRRLQEQFGTGVAEASGRPRLSADIQRFEAVWEEDGPGARVVLRAAWRIGDGEARTTTLEATAPDRDPSTLVAVMSDQVAKLAEAIAGKKDRRD